MPRPRGRGNTYSAIALVAASAMTLAGCGADEPSGAPGGLEPVSFMVTSTALSSVPVDVALSSNLFQKHGLDVEFQEFGGASTTAINAVISGEGDFGTAGGTAALDAIAAGLPIQLIANLQRPASTLVVRKEIAAKIEQSTGVTPDSPIEDRVAALKGLIVATNPPGSTHATMFNVMAEEYGIDVERDLRLVVSAQETVVAGVKAAKFDAAFWSAGTLEKNVADGDAVEWISLTAGEVPILKDLLYMVAFAKVDTIKNEPEKVKAFVTALQDGARTFAEDPQSVVPAMKDQFFPELEQGTWEASWKPIPNAIVDDLMFDKATYENTLEIQANVLDKSYETMSFESLVADFARR
jgi:NitT/TauT family transport system substrate-binding protein